MKCENLHATRALARLLAPVLAMVLLLALAVVAKPAAALADDAPTHTVKVGYYENEVFQEGAQPDAVKTGYAYEYYLKISEYTGWKYEYVYGSFEDLYQKLLDGDIDVIAGLAYRDDRADIIGYPELPMGDETYNLVKHLSDESVTSEPDSLSGKRIGVLNSALLDVLEDYLAAHEVQADVVAYGDYADLFAAFDAGKIDVLAAEGDGVGGRDDSEVIAAFGGSDYYLCVTAGRTDLLAELDAAQAQLQVDEPYYLDSLHSKYYPHTMSARAFSEPEREWIAEHDTLRVGYLNNYLPYSGTDKDGNATGIIKDIVPAIAESLGLDDLKITYEEFDSYSDMVQAAVSGQIDAAFPVGGGLYYSEENGIYQSTAVASASTNLVYKGEYDEAKTGSFAVNENNLMQYYYVKTNYPDAKITMYPSIDACLDAVNTGAVGCTTLNGLRANDILKNRVYNDLSLRQLNAGDDRCFGVPLGNEGLLKLLNRGLTVLGADYASNLASHYTRQLYAYTLSDALLDNMPIVAAIVIAIAALIIFLLVRDGRRSRRQQAALADALEAAQQASHAKTTFLNNMSHDIRTPMNAVVGFTALAASHIDNKEQVLDYLGKISTSSQHLLSLINDVLDMSRIESGKVSIDEADVHLPDLIHDLRAIIQSSITAKDQELFVDTQDVHHEDIVTDGLRLNQVLLNILSNAIKFTPAGGTISFRVLEKPSHATGYADFEFRIKDNGIGMSEEFQKTIFEAFTRERTSTVSGIQGTGLGMAISKNIVDMMGGTIAVDSTEGAGSEFIVSIPCKIGSACKAIGPVPELQGARVLVADDDTHTCLSVCSMLREIEMRPDWTNYGEEAVVRAQEAHDAGDAYSAYILDWMMTDIDGIETARRIRKVVGDDTPIIILTAYDWADIEDEAREAGVTAFCSKPLFMSELHAVLARPFQAEAEEQAQDKEHGLDGLRVLLVEDNLQNQQIATLILEGNGAEVESALNGAEAVERMQEAPAGHYDIVLMDIQMPIMDGFEATRAIRALDDAGKASIPIVAVTANAFEEDRQNVLGAGMNGYLAKPYDIPAMLGVIAELANRS